MGVSLPIIDGIVQELEEHDIAAKLSGAGGGGIVVAFVWNQEQVELIKALFKGRYDCIEVEFIENGIKVEDH